MKLNLYLTFYMKVKRTWVEESNVRPKTEKTEKKPEENRAKASQYGIWQ